MTGSASISMDDAQVDATMQHETHSGDCSDVRTVAAVKREIRDPLGFEEFYRTEFPRLMRSMFLLVPDSDEAQELARRRWSGCTSAGTGSRRWSRPADICTG
jgi:hypothetical protein